MLLIVDLNRQSLDRVVPGIRAAQLKRLFDAAGWHVLEAKYGRQLQAAFARPGGDALRRRIDEMSNEEYQSLIRRRGADLRARLDAAGRARRPRRTLHIVAALDATPMTTLHELLANLGGHDLDELLTSRAGRCGDRRPSVLFAYTIKGWGLPFAGDALNHSMLLSGEQIAALQQSWASPHGAEWDAFAPDSPEGRCCRAAGGAAARTRSRRTAPPVHARGDPRARWISPIPARLSTQEALGRVLPRLAECRGRGRAHRDDRARRGDLDPPRQLDRQGRRLRAREPPPTTRTTCSACCAGSRAHGASTSSWASPR